MDILITGISGFLGNHIFNKLKLDNNVIGIGNVIKNKSDKTYEVDLCSENETDLFLKNNSINNLDIIIHFAFKLSNDFETFITNNKISNNIVKISNHFKPRTFFNISSIRVYENANKIFNENSPTNIYKNEDFFYGLAKKCSEEIIKYNSISRTKIINLRLAQVYDSNFEVNKLFRDFKNQLLKNNIIEVWGNGERGSCFISLEIFQKYILKLLDYEFKDNLELNLGDENLLYVDVAKKIINKFGNKNSKIVYLDHGTRSKVQIDFDMIKNILNE